MTGRMSRNLEHRDMQEHRRWNGISSKRIKQLCIPDMENVGDHPMDFQSWSAKEKNYWLWTGKTFRFYDAEGSYKSVTDLNLYGKIKRSEMITIHWQVMAHHVKVQ